MQPFDSSSAQIREYPLVFWIIGIPFALVGGFVIASGGPWFFGLIFFAVGVAMLLLPNITTVRVDRAAGVVQISYRSPIRAGSKTIPINDLQSVDIESSSDSDGTTYRVALVKRSGEKVPLHSYYTSGYKGQARQAQRLRDLIGLAEPVSQDAGTLGLPVAASFEPLRDGETAGIPWTLAHGSFGSLSITRWQCGGLNYPGRFALLVQKPRASRDLLAGGLGGTISALVYRQMLKLYGFNEPDLPNLDLARPLALGDSPLKDDFSIFTCDPQGAPRLLTPWTVQALLGWAKRHPLKRIQMDSGAVGQLVVLFNEQNLSVETFASGTDAASEQELVDVGVSLAREARALAL